jgi:hypothetical protein
MQQLIGFLLMIGVHMEFVIDLLGFKKNDAEFSLITILVRKITTTWMEKNFLMSLKVWNS